MSEYSEFSKKSEIARYEKLNLPQLYQELTKALNSRNIQSIWELSKIITRVHFENS